MILSRTLAKSRLARGERPSWGAAWGLVIVDFVLFLVYAVLMGMFFFSVQTTAQMPDETLILALILFFFIPMQVVLILSALWASKSRWLDKDAVE
jgi:ACR3 family arsenite efflux pump ArsB